MLFLKFFIGLEDGVHSAGSIDKFEYVIRLSPFLAATIKILIYIGEELQIRRNLVLVKVGR